jgi:hypothetical protein
VSLCKRRALKVNIYMVNTTVMANALLVVLLLTQHSQKATHTKVTTERANVMALVTVCTAMTAVTMVAVVS